MRCARTTAPQPGSTVVFLTAARTAGQKMIPPLLAIWGGKGTVGQDFDVIGLWKQEAVTVSGHPLPCGHLIPEEDPDGLHPRLDSAWPGAGVQLARQSKGGIGSLRQEPSS
jgi:hypothetical protein